MNTTYQLHVYRKEEKNLIIIGTTPMKDLFAMLYSLTNQVASENDLPFEDLLSILYDIHNHIGKPDQN